MGPGSTSSPLALLIIIISDGFVTVGSSVFWINRIANHQLKLQPKLIQLKCKQQFGASSDSVDKPVYCC